MLDRLKRLMHNEISEEKAEKNEITQEEKDSISEDLEFFLYESKSDLDVYSPNYKENLVGRIHDGLIAAGFEE